MKKIVLICVVVLCAYAASSAAADGTVQPIFERVFGDAVKLDSDIHAKVVKGKPGERHYIDRNGDGKPEEVWFIDTARRHPEAMRPLLVRVIDEDGDLEMGSEPDLDSDLYVADWKADGTVDAVLDYTDLDGDQDVDEMAVYFPAGSMGGPGPHIMAWWGSDVGDDNLLWYDVGYTYRQNDCQYRSHFGGNELFNAYTLGLDDPQWDCAFENPFVFYDLDGDGVTEEVVRICGLNEVVENLRYSYDADDDATPDNPRDFDVSISAHATKGFVFPAELADRRTIRGIPTGPFLKYEAVREYTRGVTWADQMLTWDENDLNIDGDDLKDGVFTDTQERWEGIIAKGNEFFKQIGGPSAGMFNKRYEVATAPKGPIRVYYSPTDRRIHLFGADKMWLTVDYDYDNKPDMRYDYADTDNDGYIDQWRLDADLDGKPDDEWKADTKPDHIDYVWAKVNAIMAFVLESEPSKLWYLDVRLQQALAILGETQPDPVQTLIESGFDTPGLINDLRTRVLTSNESWRYVLDVLKDRLLVTLKKRHADAAFWEKATVLRSQGDWKGLRGLIEKTFKLQAPPSELWTVRRNLLAKLDVPRVAWAQDWVPPNIGWESERAAYRAYWGQFDFFGKSKPGLVMSTFGSGVSYHEEQEWGIDALHVGKSCGLGGVTLYVNGTGYPVYSPEGKGTIVWSKRLVEQRPEWVIIEMTAEKVGPEQQPYTVHFRCGIEAGRKDAYVEVTVNGGAPDDKLELGVGLTKLQQESFVFKYENNVMANWGFQDPLIGYIGMGIIFDLTASVREVDLPDQHQGVLQCTKGDPVAYRIQGDWLNGRRFSRCPTFENWKAELRQTAASFLE